MRPDVSAFISHDSEKFPYVQVKPGRNGFDLQFSDYFLTLQTVAEAYCHIGYAVVPLLGDFDPNRPKVAARTWSAYQQRLATLDEINSWFSPTGGAAMRRLRAPQPEMVTATRPSITTFSV